MRIAFCGKGGSGKTTLSSLFTKWLEAQEAPVIAFDGDINQHLGEALGFSQEELTQQPKIGMQQEMLRDYVRGSNKGIRLSSDILETTPPGEGSQFFHIQEESNDVLNHFALKRGSLRFIGLGGHSLEETATTCYHKYTAAMGIFLNHLLDGNGEYFVGDMVAGADPFASSGLSSRYDVIILAIEPTKKSLEVYHQATRYLEQFGLGVKVVANKIMDDEDLHFITDVVGDDFLGALEFSPYIRRLDRGEKLDVKELSPQTVDVLEKIKSLVDSIERDWDRYLDIGLRFHQIASESWATDWLGVNPMTQVDKQFRYQNVCAA